MTGLPVVSEKAAVAGIIYSALGRNGSSGNATTMSSTSIGTGGFPTPSGTIGAGGSAFIANSEGVVGLRGYSTFVVVVVVALIVGLE